MSHLTQRDIEYLRPDLERAVERVLGNGHNEVQSAIERCLHNGYDRKRTTEKLGTIIDGKKASRLYEKLEDILQDYKSSSKSRKRGYDDDDKSDKYHKKSKPTSRAERRSSRERDSRPPSPIRDATPLSMPAIQPMGAAAVVVKAPAPTPLPPPVVAPAAPAALLSNDNNSLTTQQIKLMMANAQREIEERKRALSAIKNNEEPVRPAPITTNATGIGATVAPAPAAAATAAAAAANNNIRVSQTPEDVERARKIAELQAQIKAKLSGSLSAIIPPVQEKPKPLILDEQGRTVDNSGRAISIPTLAPTLKANIRAKKKENFNKVSQPNDKQEDDGLKFVDDRISVKAPVRTKRALRFHEPGKFQQMAERMRMKSQLEKLQNEISQIARKTGISSATKLALIAPKQDSHADDVPQMEWWDSVILANDLSTMDGDKVAIRESSITNLIEHPTQMKPPSVYY